MFTKIVRWSFAFFGLGIGVILGQLTIFMLPTFSVFGLKVGSMENNFVISFSIAIIMCLLFFLAFPKVFAFFKKASVSLETRIVEQSIESNIAGVAGLIFGLVTAFLLQPIFNNMPPFFAIPLRILTYASLGYFGVRIATMRKFDLGRIAEQVRKGSKERPVKPKKTGTKGPATSIIGRESDYVVEDYAEELMSFSNLEGIEGTRPKVLDTSVIIDGRIADIIKTGFLEGPVIIPEFVLEELQKVADSADGLKRNRGRRGLDVLGAIQKETNMDIRITDANFDDVDEVDMKLLKLAKKLNGYVVTNDYNLNKVLGIQNVSVLNINELANAVKVVVLPGEEMTITVVKEGKEHNQGLAYLDDGTMIVVENGRNYLEETVEVVVTSIIQTSAGKMFFARVI